MTKDVVSVGSEYLREVRTRHESLVDQIVDRLRTTESQFDTLVGTGMSGALVLPEVAARLGVSWLAVRKPHDDSHSSKPAEGELGRRWLFLDDLVASGRTQRRVYDDVFSLARGLKWNTEYVGSYLYDQDVFEATAEVVGWGLYSTPEAYQRARGIPVKTKRNQDVDVHADFFAPVGDLSTSLVDDYYDEDDRYE